MKRILSTIILTVCITTLSVKTLAQDKSKNTKKNTDELHNLIDNNTALKYISGRYEMYDRHPTYFGIGMGAHRTTKSASAVGIYFSGLTPVGQSNYGIYGRGELIRDTDHLTKIWAVKATVGIGYYFSEKVASNINIGKCFSTATSCFFVPAEKSAERDLDSIYLGIGSFFKDPYFNNYFEVNIDWSPYSDHNSRSIYLGYGLKFK